MKLLIEQELFKQCVHLLDNLENDNGCIPMSLWDDRNRILENAKTIGYNPFNAPDNPSFNLCQKPYADD